MARSCESCKMLERNKYWHDLPFDRHQFFKIMLNGFRHQLRIPTKFTMHFKEELGNMVMLQGPSGHKWPVELSGKDEDVFFQNGWEKFALENGLEEFDFLVFRYCGNGKYCFKVSNFDPSGCERESAYYVEKHRKSSCSHLKMVEESVQIIDVSDDGGHSHMKMKQKMANLTTCPLATTSKKLAKEAPISRSIPKYDSRKKGQANGITACQSSPVPSSFKITMRHKNVCKDFIKEIPQTWAAKHISNKSQGIQLTASPNKNKWKAQIRYGSGIWQLTGGWSDFVLDNDLQKHDVCVFEISRGEPATTGKPIALDVSILRAGGSRT